MHVCVCACARAGVAQWRWGEGEERSASYLVTCPGLFILNTPAVVPGYTPPTGHWLQPLNWPLCFWSHTLHIFLHRVIRVIIPKRRSSVTPWLLAVLRISNKALGQDVF